MKLDEIAEAYIKALDNEVRIASLAKYGVELQPKEIAVSNAPGIGTFFFHKEKKDCFFFERELTVSRSGLEFVGCAVKLEL